MSSVYDNYSNYYNNDEITFQGPKYLLKIKVCSDNPVIHDFYSKFQYHHLGDCGIDMFHCEPLTVEPLTQSTIDFQIQCEMIDLETRTFASYYLAPRSSIANTGLIMANSIGIMDASYRGNVKAKVHNFHPTKTVEVPSGSIFQIISPDLKPIQVMLTDTLSSTTRNDGGFGSTNK